MLRVTALNKVLRKRSRFFLGKLSKECELRHYAIFYFNVNEDLLLACFPFKPSWAVVFFCNDQFNFNFNSILRANRDPKNKNSKQQSATLYFHLYILPPLPLGKMVGLRSSAK